MIIEKVFNAILSQLTYVSFLHYYILKSTDDWGELGKDQIQHSFCRLLCHVASEATV
jgi:hypothetical protein